MTMMSNNRIKLRRYRSDRNGLSSVITVAGIIAVILGFVVGPILSIYIPNRVKDAEAGHLDETSDAFVSIRGNINSLREEDKINSQSKVRLEMGTKLHNFMMPDSSGTLKLQPSPHEMKIYNSNNSQDIYSISGGSIEYSSKNHEYIDQRFVYESSGVIVEQGGDATMDLTPGIKLTRHTGGKTLLREKEILGNLPGYDTKHPNRIFYNFSGTSEELSISYDIYNNNNLIYSNDFNSNPKLDQLTQHKNNWFIESRLDRDNVIGQWSFSETQSSSYEESAPDFSTLTATYKGSVSHKTGKFGTGIELLAADKSIASVSSVASIELTTPHTLEAWIYPYKVNGSYYIINKLKESAKAGYALMLSGGEIRYIIGDGSNLQVLQSSGAGVKSYRWTHIAGAWDGSLMYLYINGNKVGNKTFSGPLGTNSFKLSFGSNQEGVGNFFDGIIDEVIISSGAKSSYALSDAVLSVRGNVLGGEDHCVATTDANIDSNINIEVRALANDYSAKKKNAFLVFDYQNSTNFKYAGIRPDDDKWVIGQYSGIFIDKASSTEALTVNTWYNLSLSIVNNTVKLYGSDVLKVQYTFSSIGFGNIGVANDKAHSHFDDLVVRYAIENGIEMWINGVFLGKAHTTGPDSWDGPYDKFIDDDLIFDEQTNVFEFRNIFSPKKIWALRIVEVKGNLFDLSLSSITIDCKDKIVTGSESHIINLKLLANEVNEYDLGDGNITMEITTKYYDAWWQYLDSILNDTRLSLDWRKNRNDTDYYMYSIKNPNNSATIFLVLKRISIFTLNIAVIEARID